MDDLPLWKAAEEREKAVRDLEEARARMYAAQKKFSLAHDAYLASIERHRNGQPDYTQATVNNGDSTGAQ